MADRVVINTGPLIALARAGALDVIEQIPLSFVCPLEVREELDQGTGVGHPDVNPRWLSVLRLSSPVHPIARAALDLGEAAVIQLALQEGISVVCIDESKGRHTALAVGLRITGSLGLLARAKTIGIIGAIRPYIETMNSAGAWYSEELIARVLREVGE